MLQAPLADEGDTRAFWQGSPLQIAVSRVEDELRRTAEDGDLVLAVTDADTRILWTYGGRVMRRKAETVNFVAGGRWDDESVGTNALDLANRTEPAVDGLLGRALRLDRAQLGLLGRAGQRPGHRSAARRHRPVDHLGPHPPDRAGHRPRDGPADRAGDAALPRAPGPRPHRRRPDVEGLTLRLLGTAEAHLDGRRLLLNRRQTEILALLAMNPDGVSLERLHALVYGDQGVTLSTLKAEVSHLRSALGGQLTSRPYRLTMPLTHRRRRRARRGRPRRRGGRAGGVRRRPAARHELARPGRAGRVRRGGRPRGPARPTPQPEAVVRYSELAPYDAEVIEVCLARLGDRPHPAKPLLKGRLAVAGGK